LGLFVGHIEKSRNRVNKTLRAVNSDPDILSLDGENMCGLLAYNQFGSTNTLPIKTCLLIGPEGENRDVIARKLVHADITEHLGIGRI